MKKNSLLVKLLAVVTLLSVSICSFAFAAENDQLFSEATIYAGNTYYNSDIIAKVGTGETGYGLSRIARYLSTKHGEVKFVSADYISGNTYAVTVTGGDEYANGTFAVDVYPADALYQQVQPGYQFWYGIYMPQWKMEKGVPTLKWELVGTAHGRKLQGIYVGAHK